jgi:hypothetical protein
MNVQHWWNDSDRGKQKYSEKKSCAILPIIHVLAWCRYRASAVRGQRLTGRTLVRPVTVQGQAYLNLPVCRVLVLVGLYFFQTLLFLEGILPSKWLRVRVREQARSERKPEYSGVVGGEWERVSCSDGDYLPVAME